MEYNRLDKKVVVSWRITRLIRLVVMTLILVVPARILSKQEFMVDYMSFVWLGVAAMIAYLVLSIIIYPMIEYRQWGYVIAEDRVTIKHGIFFIEVTVIPIVRIQHITIEKGLINRRLGIANVNIHTASGSFVIEGVSNETADSVADSLKSRLYRRLDAHEDRGNRNGV